MLLGLFPRLLLDLFPKLPLEKPAADRRAEEGVSKMATPERAGGKEGERVGGNEG